MLDIFVVAFNLALWQWCGVSESLLKLLDMPRSPPEGLSAATSNT